MSTNKSFSTETSERYSRALFEVAKEAGDLDKIEQNIKSFQSLLLSSEELYNFIHNPTHSKDNQNDVIDILAKKLNFPKDLKKMYELITKNNVDLVIGSRFIKSNKEMVYFRTYYANKFLSKVFSLIYRQNVTDIATCYKMMNSSYFKNIQLKERGFSIEVELLAKYFNINNKFLESSIDYSGRTYDEGKKIKIIDGFKYLWAMLKYKRFLFQSSNSSF